MPSSADRWLIETVLGGFGWHYLEILRSFGPEPIEQYHKVSLVATLVKTTPSPYSGC